MDHFPQVTNTDTVGPQGWWLHQGESSQRTMLYENIFWDKIEDETPTFCTVHEPKAADSFLLAEIKKKQAAAGIEDGLDLRFIEQLLFKDWYPWKAQIIGSCVASGAMRAIACRSMWEILVLGEPEETLGRKFEGKDNWASFAPYSYRAGRRIGGLNGGDGSFCGAHIKGLQEYGFLPCDTPQLGFDGRDLPEPQSSSAYRQWGNSNSLLDKFAAAGRRFDLLESERITSADTLKDRIVNHFKPMMICSNWGFASSGKKLSNGLVVYRRSGSWAHNMTIIGCIKVDGGWYAVVRNSWGARAHNNGDFFIITLDDMGSWLRSAECATIGDLKQREPAKFEW